MKLFLTHTYYLFEDVKEEHIMRPYPPLGLLYVSAFLKENEFDTKVFDATFSSFEDQRKSILEDRPDVIAIYCNMITKLNVIRLVKWIRSVKELNHSKIVFGGPDLRNNIENYLSFGADFLVIGEGEQTMLELVNSLKNGVNDFSQINGLAFLDGDSLVLNNERIKIKKVDELPLPDREGIDMNPYLNIWEKHHGTRTMSISTQRGCPYTCKWCSTAVYGQSYRRRSATLVVDEIEHLINTYDANSFWFVDDVFTVSHKWIESFYEEVLNRNIEFEFECITRAERLNDDVLRMLSEIGCSKIWIGAESGSQKIIDEMDRRVKVTDVSDMIKRTKDFGIGTGTFIMLGYPKEEIEDIEETISYLKNCSPDDFTITIAYPIKGTALYNQIENDIITDLDWHSSTDRDIDFKRAYSPRFYQYAVKYVVNSVIFHRKKRT